MKTDINYKEKDTNVAKSQSPRSNVKQFTFKNPSHQLFCNTLQYRCKYELK